MRPIDRSLVRVPLRGSSKQEAIGELLDLLVAQGLVQQRDTVFAQLLEREAKKSTAIGYGVAIPHVRTEHVRETVCAFGVSASGNIDFSNHDEPASPAELLFLMVSPRDDAPTHLRTLAKIARLIKDEDRRASLRAATGTDEVLALLGDLATP